MVGAGENSTVPQGKTLGSLRWRRRISLGARVSDVSLTVSGGAIWLDRCGGWPERIARIIGATSVPKADGRIARGRWRCTLWPTPDAAGLCLLTDDRQKEGFSPLSLGPTPLRRSLAETGRNVRRAVRRSAPRSGRDESSARGPVLLKCRSARFPAATTEGAARPLASRRR